MFDAHAYLLSLPRFAVSGQASLNPGLDRIEAVLDALGHPQDAYPTIHIAGTNGKGSTAAFLASFGRISGATVGLHTSPHLFRLNERMRVNGLVPSDAWLHKTVRACVPIFNRVGVSFFEATLALSFLYFEEHNVDFAVIETGLGGRLDASNVLTPAVSVITSIGFDHMDVLGHSLAKIAQEKSGIIKAGVPVVAGVDKEEALRVVVETAYSRAAPLHDVYEEVKWSKQRGEGGVFEGTWSTPVHTYGPVVSGLPGRHQFVNIASALRAFEIFFPRNELDVKSITRGIEAVKEQTGFRGRLEIVKSEPLIALDVCHNYDSLGASIEYVKDVLAPRSGHLFVAFGTMRDKDVEQMASLMAMSSVQLFIVPLHSERALPPGELKRHITGAGDTCSHSRIMHSKLCSYF